MRVCNAYPENPRTLVLGSVKRRGAFNSEQEARQAGVRDLGNDFEVVMLPTRDVNRARGMLKEIVLKQTHDIDFAMRRFKTKL